jgi:ABC-2 type transport system permease protein
MLGSALAFEARRMSRNFPPLFFGLGFPVMMLAIFGGIYGNKPNPQFGGLGTVDISLPAYVALVLAVAGLMSFPLGMVEYRSRGFLRLLRTTPARPNAFLAGQVLINGVVCLAGIGLLVVFGMMAFDLDAPSHLLAFIGLAVLSGGSVFGLGMLIAALAQTEAVASVVANVVFFPMIFMSGATVPLEIMPSGMRHISDALPLTYAVNALKWAWLDKGGDDLPLALGVLGGTFVICALLSARLFRWE